MSLLRISPTYDANADVVLYNGDAADLLHAVPDTAVSLVITSPPYNLGKQYEKRSSLDEYLRSQKPIIEECVRVLRGDGSLCWQVGNYVENGEIVPLDIILFPIFQKLGLKLRNRIVWHFGHGLHASKRFSGRYETLLWFTRSDKYVFDLDSVRVPQKYPNKKYFKGPKIGQLSSNPLGKNPGDVWEIPNVKANHVEKTVHPCQFPVELVERLVLSMTTEGDVVLDPFMGVGSTAIAALIHHRKVWGSEIRSDYVAIAKERITCAQDGTLRTRPMERRVYDPSPSYQPVPPRVIRIGIQPEAQPRLMERRADYVTSTEGK